MSDARSACTSRPRRTASALLALAAFAPGFVGACGRGSPPPKAAATSVREAPPADADAGEREPEPVAGPPTLGRASVRAAVAEGPASILARLELDDRPVLRGGKFYGFRIARLRGDPEFWRGVDLSPGDVVTGVNGFSIERPEQAYRAFQSLEVASELRVDFERDGAPRTLRIPIVD